MRILKKFTKDLCWIIFSALLLIFIGTPLFIYSYKDKFTSKGFMRFLTLWLMVVVLYLFRILTK